VAAEEKLKVAESEKEQAEAKAEKAEDPAKKAAEATTAAAKARQSDAVAKEVAQKEEAVKKEAEKAEEVKGAEKIREISRASDLDMVDGQEVTLVGIYMPRPDKSGQNLGHVSIMVGNVEVRLGDKTRSLSEILKLSGESVAITGKLDLKKTGDKPAEGAKAEKPILNSHKNPSRR
ncbi:MAG TPA: hypothetical protein PKW90_15215, partial [Myxococcota bacterium]|nr:hypothetical protein [Myxococcota bacterium]